jgi:hypothetical protein
MSIVKTLKGAVIAAMVAGTALSATGASAAVINLGSLGVGSTSTDVSGLAVGTYSDEFDFSLSIPYTFAAFLSTISVKGAGNIDFIGGYIDTVSNPFTFASESFGTATIDVGSSGALDLAAGAHKIFVDYKVKTGPASYSLDVSVAPVPEPATWGMMLVGFGLVGAGMRSRKRSMVLA